MAENITLEQLKRGDVITFFYSGGTDLRPVVLFLNVYKNLIHGLNLHYFSAAQIAYLKVILGNELYTIHMIENPKDFYDNQIKKYNLTNAYRTYKPEKTIRLSRIGYKVQTIEKDTGIIQKPEDVMPSDVRPKTTRRYTTKPDIKSTLPDDYVEQITKTTIPKNIFGNFFQF